MTTLSNTQKTGIPAVFFFLFVPYGMVAGYLTVTIGFVYAKVGISPGIIAGLIASMFIPQIFKFLWVPLVDVTWKVKKWYMLTASVAATALFATSVLPVKASNWYVLSVLCVFASFACTFLGAAAYRLAAYAIPFNKKGMVSGFIQAGNLGGFGLGGGMGVWLVQRLSATWMAVCIIEIIFFLCCSALFFVRDVQTNLKDESALKTIENIIKDVWQTIKNQKGLLAMLLCLMPIGTGSAKHIFSAIRADWKVSGDIVALVIGFLGGLASVIGCLIGGWICDKINRQIAYVIMGLTQAACCIALAFLPHTQFVYISWTLIYAITSGLTYAAFSAFTLEAIGQGAAATKFELFASISNAPIYLMVTISGIAYTNWKARGMLITEAFCALIAAVLFVSIRLLIKKSSAVM